MPYPRIPRRLGAVLGACAFATSLHAAPQPQINFEKIPTQPEEPLRAELSAFSRSVRNRRPPRVDGAAGRAALELADRVMAGIQEHALRVQLDAVVPQDNR